MPMFGPNVNRLDIRFRGKLAECTIVSVVMNCFYSSAYGPATAVRRLQLRAYTNPFPYYTGLLIRVNFLEILNNSCIDFV